MACFVERRLDIAKKTLKKSAFLLGPRQTGKTSLIKSSFAKCTYINLLLNDEFFRFSQNPGLLREVATEPESLVVIDEIQKVPTLLNEVHHLIEEKGIRFLLTGSSARKLRKSGVNLLGGRARLYHLNPFSFVELKEQFDLLKALNFGMLPSIYFSDDPQVDLDAYVGLYLKEEIHNEALIRNLPAFSRFLEVAALSNGHIINYSNISSDSGVPRTTVMEYFSVLEDTLFATMLAPWKKSKKRKPISTSKFYFFDIGVVGKLQGRGKIKLKSPMFGDAFESFFFQELKAYSDYKEKIPLNYWRSTSNFEVDFILDNRIGLEVKGKSIVGERDLKGCRALMEEGILEEFHVVSLETRKRVTEDGISIWPWKQFLNELWAGKL